jgi:D-amino-acid oxidase
MPRKGNVRSVALAAVVVGGGVSGLTTAVCLAEAGVDVQVMTADDPLATTSAAAGAMWGPYLVEPRDRVRRWSLRTLHELRRLGTQGGTGVKVLDGVEASRVAVKPPDWADMVEDLRPCGDAELPSGFAAGWRFSTPVVNMPVYLNYLVNRFQDAGGRIEIAHVTSLSLLAAQWPVIVNCAGLGARDLVPDPTIQPIRGQLVVTENPGISDFFTEDTGMSPDLCHIYPQGETLVLGGTAEPGNWSRQPDHRTADEILKRCQQVDPRLAGVTVLEHRVGLRPTTSAVQVRKARLGTSALVHNYGHGGAGVTLSWGCAHEVTDHIVR